MENKKQLNAIINQKSSALTDAVDHLYQAVGLSDIRAEQGRLGGLVRRITSEARVFLTEKMIKHLGIEATQTVAKRVMLETFGRAASTADLSDKFATPGRGADEKFVDHAMKILENNVDDVASYRADYEAFLERLHLKLDAIKAARKPS